MPHDISFAPMRVLIVGHDSKGNLVLADNQLAAMFIRLNGTHHAPEHRGVAALGIRFRSVQQPKRPPVRDDGRSRKLGLKHLEQEDCENYIAVSHSLSGAGFVLA